MLRATEAKSLGIVLDTVPVAQLAGSAVAVARSIAAKPPQALRMTKRLMKCAQRLELPDFLELCAVFQGICHNTADHQEAVAAFIEKRAPQFIGA
jgi:enoyl-CoA hydratase/carnithine racemase